jgi:hypothetical protein
MSSEMMSQTISTAVVVGVLVMMVASIWRIFSKAGEAGWKCLIPIYSAFVMQRILGRPWWWVLWLCVPGLNLIPAVIECFDLAKVFGKGAGYGLGLLFLGPIFMLALAFGNARYVGPNRSTPQPMQRAA